MRVKVKRAGHEVARGHDRWHIDCVDAMTRPAGTRESMPGPTSDSLGSAWRRAEQRQELRDGWVFGVERSSVWSRYLYAGPERGCYAAPLFVVMLPPLLRGLMVRYDGC